MSEENYSFIVTNTNGSGAGSFAEAIFQAAACGSNGTPEITFDASLAGESISLESGVWLRRDVRIINLQDNPVILTGTGLNQFRFDSGEAYLKNMKFEGSSLFYGGYDDDRVTCESCFIGGEVEFSCGNLELIKTTVTGVTSVRGKVIMQEGSSMEAKEGSIRLYGVLESNGAHVDSTLYLTNGVGKVTGTEITFNAPEAIRLDTWSLGDTMPDISEYISSDLVVHTVGDGAKLGLNSVTLSVSKLLFSQKRFCSQLPDWIDGVCFGYLQIDSKEEFTVDKDNALLVDSLNVRDGGFLTVLPGATIAGTGENGAEIYINNDADGSVNLVGVTLDGVMIQHNGGKFNMESCSGTGTLDLGALRYTFVEPIIRNCDLSGIQIKLTQPTSSSNKVVYNLSGNYWGTTDMEVIKSMIEGYDEAYIKIDSVLSAPPNLNDTTPPELKLYTPKCKDDPDHDGMVLVSVSWSVANEVAYYELRVGDELLYSGWDTEYTASLAPGTYSFSVTATDAWGNSKTYDYDKIIQVGVSGPVLTLKAPEFHSKKNGKASVTLSWESDPGCSYEVLVDGNSVYSGKGTSCTFMLSDGEHTYTVNATNAGGKTSTKTGDCSFDATAPDITLNAPDVLKRDGKGKGEVRLSWTAEAGVSYTLKVDGKVVYSGSDNECALVLKEGKHKYELTSADAAGNTSEPLKGHFSFDATAPKLKLGKTSVARVDEGAICATLSWKSEKGATYVVEVDGEVVYSGTETTYATTTLRDGEHSYKVTATDAEGNTSEQEGSFSLDATAPVVNLSADAPAVFGAKNGKAKVSLTWEENEEGVRYTVMVDGKKVYSGTKPECTVNLKDGEHRYYITAEDKAGNVGQSAEGSFTFDATAPIVTLQTPTISYETEGSGKGTVTLAATSNEEGTSYRVTLTKDGKALEGEYGLALGELADGTYKYTLIAVDAAGNESKMQTGSFLVDSTPPGTPVLKGEVKCSRKGENKSDVKLSWTAPLDPADPKGKKTEKVASYHISCYDDEGNLLQSVSSKGASYTFKGLQDGNYHFHVSAVDKAGNGGEALRVENVAVDTVAPEITGLAHEVFLGEMGAGKSGAALSWEGGEEAAATYIIKLGGKTYTFAYDAEAGEYQASAKVGKETVTLSLWQAEDGSFTYYHPVELKDGKYKYSITATDAAGNKKEYKGEEALVVDSKTLPDMDDSDGSQMRPGISSLSAGLSLDYQLQLSAGVPGMAATGLADACCASGPELLSVQKADKSETSLLA